MVPGENSRVSNLTLFYYLIFSMRLKGEQKARPAIKWPLHRMLSPWAAGSKASTGSDNCRLNHKKEEIFPIPIYFSLSVI
jgi:hypothetical protein